ncbi:hypothetical protein JVX88_08590 [Leptolyngbya sp. 7M]|nr:hypothetical protein [Leptolyngbya sp. 7M]QYO66845.1 hypothetical protein JVX88_08590 [Leptolyngbya sp. 7M]
MLRRSIFFLAVVSLFVSAIPAQNGGGYPRAKKVDQVDDYHGTKVYDPYRWLEETNSADTQRWIEEQVAFTQAYMDKIPEREKIRERLTEIWNYERISAPSKVTDGFYIYSRNDGLQNQNVLYRTDSKDKPGKIFFDPNKLSEDGTAALSGSAFTDDGKLWAYGIARSGSDRTEWRIMNTETGEHLSDTLPPNRQGGISWASDNSGFYYQRYPAPEAGAELRAANRFPKIYFHKLGTPISEDKVIYERPDDGELTSGARVTEDGKWLVISTSKGTQRMNEVHFKDLSRPDSPIIPLVSNRDSSWAFVGNDGPIFYFRTDKDAERGKLVSVNVLARAHIWRDVIPHSKDTLNGVQMINNQFVANYLKDAYTNIKIYDKNGKHVRDVELPGIGSAGGFGGKQDATETFYSFSSFNAPPTIYHYDMKTGKSTLFRTTPVKFDGSQYEVKQVFFNSKDGTRVPMFIAHKKGLKLDGSNPTILYGYGGFNISQTPARIESAPRLGPTVRSSRYSIFAGSAPERSVSARSSASLFRKLPEISPLSNI